MEVVRGGVGSGGEAKDFTCHSGESEAGRVEDGVMRKRTNKAWEKAKMLQQMA